MPAASAAVSSAPQASAAVQIDWARVAYRVLLSRALDDLEENQLLPQRKVLYQFCARGHDLTQTLLGEHLTGEHDGAAVYYRSRPLVLSVGLAVQDALASTMMKQGGVSEGRDIGVVFNLPRTDKNKVTVLPACGGVGAQYTPASGWAQALVYQARTLKNQDYFGSIAVAHGGDGSVATNGFWASLTVATTERLPVLFFIEDNGYGISVPSFRQTPGADIAANLKSFRNLKIIDGDGSDPQEAAQKIGAAVAAVRTWEGPVLLRLRVPRLSGHSGQDTQAYKPAELIADERSRDPLTKLKQFLVPKQMSAAAWQELEERAKRDVQQALEQVEQRPQPEADSITANVFSEVDSGGQLQRQGGLASHGYVHAAGSTQPRPEATRINMLTAIRRTLESELAVNPKLVVFGEDVGPKGGVHAATLGLQEKFGDTRVFDTSLSEEGIIGRAVGMAVAGLLPVPEIQFRKYAEPAMEQLNDCGTMRWRTANRFAAPMVVRMPGGFFKCGDPWHSQTNEVQFVHAIGWRVAVPSNAEDAVGLLRSALRGNDPTIFFEHRAMLDGAWARRPYPGDDYVVPFGQARIVRTGAQLTVVTWGALVERCEEAAKQSGIDAEIIDLRSLMPWDKEAVLASVRKTRRCLVVHEDNQTAGFGAEIVAVLAQDAFFDLDAPVQRLTMPDIPSPHTPLLLNAAVPSVEKIALNLRELAEI